RTTRSTGRSWPRAGRSFRGTASTRCSCSGAFPKSGGRLYCASVSPRDAAPGRHRQVDMAEQQAPRFLTVAEVAELLRVSKMTVYRMVHAGDIPAVRVGRSFRVPQLAVEEMLSTGIGGWTRESQAGWARHIPLVGRRSRDGSTAYP